MTDDALMGLGLFCGSGGGPHHINDHDKRGLFLYSQALIMTSISLYGLLIVIILAIWFIRSRKTPNLPPGPPANPILGHLRIMPTTNHGDVFHKWAKIYGTRPRSAFYSANDDFIQGMSCI